MEKNAGLLGSQPIEARDDTVSEVGSDGMIVMIRVHGMRTTYC